MNELIYNISAWLMIFSAFIAAFSQILLKTSANKQYKKKIYEILNARVVVGYALLLLTMVINIFAYKGLNYKYGPILNSTTYIFVLLLSHYILKEKINKNKMIGIFAIVLGLIIYNF